MFRLCLSSAVLLATGLFLALLIAASYGKEQLSGVQGGCDMSWMSPTYVLLDAFTKGRSRLADKYELYMYREAGYDRPEIDGIPVLFVPGNAGSFRQVRSLAASSARQWHNETGQKLGAFVPREGSRHLDWYTVDFNEDFSAFHGTTLLEQSEYLNDAVKFILSLYDRSPRPASVIMVAHSMGGISVRKMMRTSNYVDGSITTIITLSTPHIMPPATFDHDIEHIYDDINAFWREGFWAHEIGHLWHPLSDVLLVSIVGGTSDAMISAETASLVDLVPPTNGFTVFTTSVPYLYAPVDHLAIMWCDQLRSRIARALLDIVDDGRPEQTGNISRRNDLFRRHLLSGFPDELSPASPESIILPEIGAVVGDDLEQHHWQANETLIITSERPSKSAFVSAIDGTNQSLVLLTDASRESFEVLGCREANLQECISLLQEGQLIPIPQSHLLAPTPNDAPPQSYLRVDFPLTDAAAFRHVAVFMKSDAPFGYLVAQLLPTSSLDLVIGPTLLQAFLGFTVPIRPHLVSQIRAPFLDSALLVYSASLRSDCPNRLFAPLLRVFSTSHFESHWYPHFSSARLFLHGSAPYVFNHKADSGGLNLQLWQEPNCVKPVRLYCKVDVFSSLGKVVLRYRTAFAAWPFALSLLLLARQLRMYARRSGHMGSLIAGTFSTLGSEGPRVASVLACLCVLQVVLLSIIGSRSSWMTGALLGNDRLIFASALPALLLVLTSAFVLAFSLLLQLTVSFCGRACTALIHWSPQTLQRLVRPDSDGVKSSPVQRAILLVCLVLSVLVFTPCQFAMLVLTLVHLYTTIRSFVLATLSAASSRQELWDVHLYHLGTLLVLLTLLPINAPVLLVWTRNLLAGYYAPFSSDRNPLRIIGIFLWTDAVHSDRQLPSSAQALVYTRWLCLLSCYYVLIYGIRYTYSAFPLANVVFLSLAVSHWSADRSLPKRQSASL